MNVMFAALLFACPVGTIDRVESGQMAVLGASGVRVVAVGTVLRSGTPRRPHEGDRVELSPEGRCVLAPPDVELRERIERRLRSLVH